MIRVTFTHGTNELSGWFDEHNSLLYIHKDSQQAARYFFPSLVAPFASVDTDGFARFDKLVLNDAINPDDLRIEFSFKPAPKNAADKPQYQPILGEGADNLRGQIFATVFKPKVQLVHDKELELETASQREEREARELAQQRLRAQSKSDHNWFVTQMLKLKANTWDKLPTWAKWVVGGALVLATLVGVFGITFGTAGLIAPAFAASILVGMHLVAAGASIPVAAFIGALAGGAVAAFLFGVVPATVATTAKIAAPAAVATPLLLREKKSGGDESCCSSFMAKLNCCPGDEVKKREEQVSLIGHGQKKSCCSGESRSADADNEGVWARIRSCLPEACGGTPSRHMHIE